MRSTVRRALPYTAAGTPPKTGRESPDSQESLGWLLARGIQHQDKPGRCPEKTGSWGLQPHDNPGRRRKATALCLRIHRLLRPGRLERLERFL